MKELKLKDIEFNDVYECAEIIKSLDVDIDEKELEKLEGTGMKSGIILAKNVIGNLKKSKKSMNAFLGFMFGISGDEFGHLGLKDMAIVMKQLVELKKSGELVDFLDAVNQLM